MSDGWTYFLTEYKKRLPDTPENKDFHEHIDYMIRYFKSDQIIYQHRWDDWISPNDERYWRNPNTAEAKIIQDRRDQKEEAKAKGWLSRIHDAFRPMG